MTGAPAGTLAPLVCFGAPTADPSLSSTEARTGSVLDPEDLRMRGGAELCFYATWSEFLSKSQMLN